MRDFQALLQCRQEPAFVGVEREREASTRSHDVAGELRSLRPDAGEMDRSRVAVEHGGDVDQIDRFVVDLALSQLNQALDEPPQPKALGVGARLHGIGAAIITCENGDHAGTPGYHAAIFYIAHAEQRQHTPWANRAAARVIAFVLLTRGATRAVFGAARARR